MVLVVEVGALELVVGVGSSVLLVVDWLFAVDPLVLLVVVGDV